MGGISPQDETYGKKFLNEEFAKLDQSISNLEAEFKLKKSQDCIAQIAPAINDELELIRNNSTSQNPLPEIKTVSKSVREIIQTSIKFATSTFKAVHVIALKSLKDSMQLQQDQLTQIHEDSLNICRKHNVTGEEGCALQMTVRERDSLQKFILSIDELIANTDT